MVNVYHENSIVIVLHEIYGINTQIHAVRECLLKKGFDCIVPNLLNGKGPFAYDQEEIAYQYFMRDVGFESAFNRVKMVLESVRAEFQRVYVLGFSVGATLAWLCSETGLCDTVVGFYGSRIRNYLDIQPKCPALLFFPAKEKTFEVDKVVACLTDVKDIRVVKLPGLHGFADPFSPNYDKKSAIKAYKQIRSFFQLFDEKPGNLYSAGKVHSGTVKG